MSDSVTLWTVAYQASLSMGILQARIVERVAMLSSGGVGGVVFPTQGSNPVTCVAGDSLPSELPGKPKSTGVGNLSFLQGTFLIQELN